MEERGRRKISETSLKRLNECLLEEHFLARLSYFLFIFKLAVECEVSRVRCFKFADFATEKTKMRMEKFHDENGKRKVGFMTS